MIKIIISESKKVKPKKNLRFVLRESLLIVLRESLLNEVTMEQVLVAVTSKTTRNIIFNYLQPFLDKDEQKRKQNNHFTFDDYRESMLETYITIFQEQIQKHIPSDIDENAKALCVIWLKNYFLSNIDVFDKFVYQQEYVDHISTYLERFFQFKNFIEPREKRDLNAIKDFKELEILVKQAQPLYQTHQAKKLNLDAEKGTEVIYEDEKWKIFIPHNKGAACELGKGTVWCTAAPGLEYYKQYHKPDDPLFIIYEKQDQLAKDLNLTVQKYQFHYGSGQFMDATDTPIEDTELFKKVHKILLNTVGDKFPFFKSFLETDIGYSKKNIEKNSDGTLNIEYGDVLTGQLSPSVYPNVKVKKISTVTSYLMDWSNGNYIENRHGPGRVEIRLENEDKVLSLYLVEWRVKEDSSEIAILEHDIVNVAGQTDASEYNLQIFDEKIWNSLFKKDYEQNIKGREEEYAKEILQKYYVEAIGNK